MKILILENDDRLHDSGGIDRWSKKQIAAGHEVKFVFKAYSKEAQQKIFKLINWPDVLAFDTTFIYIYPIMALAKGISRARTTELKVLIKNDGIDAALERMMKLSSDRYNNEEECWEEDPVEQDKFAYSLRNLKIFQLDWQDNKHVPITFLDEHIARETKRISELHEYMRSRHTESARTGRHIKIRTFSYNPGPEWSKLKTGMIVPEIDMRHIDTRPDRGVWVMGFTEPVKLLNEAPYDEYEIVVRNEYDLAEELIKKCNAPLSPLNVMAVIGILKETELTAHWKATEIIDMLGAERRHNRCIMTERIEAFEKRVA